MRTPRLLGFGFLALALLLSGCEDRPRTNPLDPSNPETGGGPSAFFALAENEATELVWRAAPVGTALLGFSLERRLLPSGSFTPVGLIYPLTSTGTKDPGLTNDETYEYRLSFLNADTVVTGRPALSQATPGPERIWVSDPGADAIVRLTPDGRRRSLTIPNVSTVNRLAIDPADGAVWASEPLDGRVRIFNGAGHLLHTITGLSQPNAVAVDAVSGTAWVCDEFSGIVRRYDRAGTIQATSPAVPLPVDVAMAPASQLWIVDQGGPKSTAGRAILAGQDGVILNPVSVGSDPRRIAVDLLDGSIWVTRLSPGEVQHLSASGAELVRIGGLRGPYAVDIDEGRNRVWVGLDDANAVIALDRTSGALVHTVNGIARPRGLSVADRTGDVWVAAIATGEIVRIGTDGTIRARLAGFEAPFDVRVDPGPR